MTANEVMLPWQTLHSLLSRMDQACKDSDLATIRQMMLEMPLGFAPKDDICDLVWLQKRKIHTIEAQA